MKFDAQSAESYLDETQVIKLQCTFGGLYVPCIDQLSLSHLIYPLTARVVGALQMISQGTSFLNFSLFSTALLDLANSRPVPSSSSVYLVFFPLSLCLARWFWPDLMDGRHDHATAVCVSLRWSGGLRVVRLPVGSWHGLLVGNMVFV